MSEYLEFEDLTEDQIAVFWNGVGSQHYSVKPPDLIFAEASKEHDFYYWRGGDSSDRKYADTKFYKECKLAANQYFDKWYKLPGWLMYCGVAYIYYLGLRNLGSKAFEYKPKVKTWEELLARLNEYQQPVTKRSYLSYKLQRRKLNFV